MGAARVAVAYSGGRDSTALLHATLHAAAPLGIVVVALHVHHGLSPNADAWLEHCRAMCECWARAGHALTFVAERLDGRPEKGMSIEAWARHARYAALRSMALAHGASLVLLAQHRRDQAETLLLQALRGSGVAGLAGMPKLVEREGVHWARPWLARSREAIEDYVREHRLAYIEDESNRNPRFARNRLRLQVWPKLLDAFPQAEASLAAAAAWAHEAASAMAEIAALDLEAVAVGPQMQLDLTAWSMLSPARRSNVLRTWLWRHTRCAPSAALGARLCNELLRSRSARWPLHGGELRCHRGFLTWHDAVQSPSPSPSPTHPRETSLSVPRAGIYPLPGWAGALKATRTNAGGVALAALSELDLVPRSGAEQFQAGPRRPPRSLKKQYQAAGVPAWQRSGPLVYSAGLLVFVPGLGIDARSLTQPGEAQVRFDWIAGTAPR